MKATSVLTQPNVELAPLLPSLGRVRCSHSLKVNNERLKVNYIHCENKL